MSLFFIRKAPEPELQRRRSQQRFSASSLASLPWQGLAYLVTAAYRHRRNPTLWLIFVILLELMALSVLRVLEGGL